MIPKDSSVAGKVSDNLTNGYALLVTFTRLICEISEIVLS